MEAQVVELTVEQLDALLNAIAHYGHACVSSIVTAGFFIAFELAAFELWRTIFKE